VALVTGAGRRVGRAIALELARAGCHIAVHFRRSRDEAEQVAAEITALGRRATTISGDLGDPAAWPHVVDRTVAVLGGLDVLVNNAAEFLTREPDDLAHFGLEAWERMLRINVIAPVGLCHHARPHLARSGRGKVVNLCDASADRPWPDHLAYCASKASLAAVTKGLARALAPSVQVNGIAPGIAVFPESYDAELRRSLTKRVPLGREGTPEEVARLARFLVESGDYMTGEIVSIDGGRGLT
jgi:pteridine reductase